MNITIKEILIKNAEYFLNSYKGMDIPIGHNGPHFDSDTTARNTANLLKIYVKAYQITGDPKFLSGIDECIHTLLSNKLFPNQTAFLCRTSFGKDNTNGLIGQAWVLEALILAGRLLDREELLREQGEDVNEIEQKLGAIRNQRA